MHSVGFEPLTASPACKPLNYTTPKKYGQLS